MEQAEKIFELVWKKQIPVFISNEREFGKISNTMHAPGIGAVLDFPIKIHTMDSLLNLEKTNIILGIGDLNDPGNLGTIIRTAEWLGIDGLVLGEKVVAWHNDKVVRASMGALFHLPFIQSENFSDFLQSAIREGFTIFAADQNGKVELSEITVPSKSLLLFGDEAHGLSSSSLQAAQTSIRIPGRGKVESLNVASAAAIIMAKFCENKRG